MKVGDLVEFDDDGVRLGIYGLIVSEHGARHTGGLIYKNVYFFDRGDNHFPKGIRLLKQENLVIISESR